MKPSVFLIVLDSLRADRAPPVSESHMPNLREFSECSYVFSKAYATGSWTVPSHGSILTGEYPSVHGTTSQSKQLPKNITLLPELVSNSGYDTALISANPWVSPEFGYDRGFDSATFIDNEEIQRPFPQEETVPSSISLSNPLSEFLVNTSRWVLAGNPIKRVANLGFRYFRDVVPYAEAKNVTKSVLAGIDPVEPSFVFVNYMDAHEPYRPRDEFRWNLNSINNKTDEEKASEAIDKYDESVEYLDHWLGVLFDGMKKRGVFEDSLIIVTSDHGQALGEGDYWGHGSLLLESLINVPLLIRPPNGIENTPIHQPWSLRKLFNIVSRVTESNEYDLQNLIEESTETIVAAESAGPHMDVDVPPEEVSPEGYRAYRGPELHALENFSKTSPYTIKSTTQNEDIIERIETFRSKHGLKNEFAKSDEHLDEGTEGHLRDLGYIS